MVKTLLELFIKKELQKTNQKEFRIQKVIKSKESNICMSNGEDSWIGKSDLI